MYFGDIGENSSTLTSYFTAHGARECGKDENPAEYMLEIAAMKDHDWFETWKNSDEAREVSNGIEQIAREKANAHDNDQPDENAHSEFAMPFTQQLTEVTYRSFQQYWRMPSYISAKMLLSIGSGLFIGFSFWDADTSQQGMVSPYSTRDGVHDI